MNTALDRIFDLLIGAINLFRFWIVLDTFEQGVILRLGKFHKEVGPGLHWRRPFSIDVLLWLNKRKRVTDSWEMTLTSFDKKTITISFDMIVEVYDAKLALLSVDNWVQVSYTAAKITLAQMVNSTNSGDIMSHNFADKVHKNINEILQVFGIKIFKFGITDKTFSRAFRLFKGAST